MGSLSNRYWTKGGHRGGRKKGNLGPLKMIVEVIAPAVNLFDSALVKLECGHLAKSNGQYRACCRACRDSQERTKP